MIHWYVLTRIYVSWQVYIKMWNWSVEPIKFIWLAGNDSEQYHTLNNKLPQSLLSLYCKLLMKLSSNPGSFYILQKISIIVPNIYYNIILVNQSFLNFKKEKNKKSESLFTIEYNVTSGDKIDEKYLLIKLVSLNLRSLNEWRYLF